MSINVDSRIFDQQIPLAPLDEKGLLDWARRLVVALKEEKKPDWSKYTPDYASVLDFSPSTSDIFRLTTVHATGNCTINAVSAARLGPVWIIITNDATSGKTITFGTGFSSSGALVGTASKTAVIAFISDGVKLYEVSRITGLT